MALSYKCIHRPFEIPFLFWLNSEQTCAPTDKGIGKLEDARGMARGSGELVESVWLVRVATTLAWMICQFLRMLSSPSCYWRGWGCTDVHRTRKDDSLPLNTVSGLEGWRKYCWRIGKMFHSCLGSIRMHQNCLTFAVSRHAWIHNETFVTHIHCNNKKHTLKKQVWK